MAYYNNGAAYGGWQYGGPAAAATALSGFGSAVYDGDGAGAGVRPTAGFPGVVPAWMQVYDGQSGAMYYFNRLTGVTQWEPPAVFQPVAMVMVNSSATAAQAASRDLGDGLAPAQYAAGHTRDAAAVAQNGAVVAQSAAAHAHEARAGAAQHEAKGSAAQRRTAKALGPLANAARARSWSTSSTSTLTSAPALQGPSAPGHSVSRSTSDATYDPDDEANTSDEGSESGGQLTQEGAWQSSASRASTRSDADDLATPFTGTDERCWGRPGRSGTVEDLDECETASAVSGAGTVGRFRTFSSIDQQSLETFARFADTNQAGGERLRRKSVSVSFASAVKEEEGEEEEDAQSSSAAGNAAKSLEAAPSGQHTLPPPPPPLRRDRANTTNSIYVTSTMTDPDASEELACVSAVIQAHMAQFALGPRVAIPTRYRVFEEDFRKPASGTAQQDQGQQTGADSHEHAAAATATASAVTTSTSTSAEAGLNARSPVPTRDAILGFVRDVYQKAQMEKECLIMSFAYLERLLKATKGRLALTAGNWKGIVLSTMILASKVWDDLSMWNADFSLICPSFTLKRINELEISLLEAIKYEVRVSSSQYAKYYFQLRAMRGALGLTDGVGAAGRARPARDGAGAGPGSAGEKRCVPSASGASRPERQQQQPSLGGRRRCNTLFEASPGT